MTPRAVRFRELVFKFSVPSSHFPFRSFLFLSVLFPLSSFPSSPGLPVYQYLIVSVAYFIWLAIGRNLATFRQGRLSSQPIVNNVIKDV